MSTLNPAMAWLVLCLAGLCEVGWAIGLKYADGFTRLWPSLITVVLMLVSVALLAWTFKVLPVGTAYAVWTGIGALGTAVLGMLLFDEPRTLLRAISLTLIVVGIVGLKLVTPESQ